MHTLNTSFIHEAVFIGDPGRDTSGVMFESALMARGISSTWISTENLHAALQRTDGTSVLSLAHAHPLHVQGTANEFSLVEYADAFHSGVLVFNVGDDYGAYAGLVAGVLARYGVVQMNSSRALEVGEDKWLTREAFVRSGLPVPMAMLARGEANIRRAVDELGYPVVLKHRAGSRGDGVRLAENASGLIRVMAELDDGEASLEVIVEHYVECGARDVRVLIMDGNVVGAMERRAAAGDFRANIALGGTGVMCELSEEQASLAASAANAVGSRFVGVDIAVVERELSGRGYLPEASSFLIEVNPRPGLAGIHAATGIDYGAWIIDAFLNNVDAVAMPVA